MFDLASVQSALREQQLDGWLLYDFRGLNLLARRILGMSNDSMLSRRWFYFVPVQGEPKKLVHQIEPRALDAYPGTAKRYLRWQELEAGAGPRAARAGQAAMERASRKGNPYVWRRRSRPP